MAIIYYGDVNMSDNVALKFGAGNDLSISHSTGPVFFGNFISSADTVRDLTFLSTVGFQFKTNVILGETLANFNANGSVDLYYDNSKKFETTSSGVQVAGIMSATTVGVTNIVTNKIVKFNGSILDDSTMTDDGTNVTMTGDFTVQGGDITLGGTGRIQGVDTVTDSTDAANKAYVDAHGGGLGPFLPLAGGTMTGTGNVTFPNNFTLKIGTSSGFEIYHTGSNTVLDNLTGNVYHTQWQDNGDVYFQNDRGDGNVANFFYLDGGLTDNVNTLGATVFPDKSKIFMGNSNDLQIYHDGSNSYVTNATGNLYVSNSASGADVVFKGPAGFGTNTATYFFLDGSQAIYPNGTPGRQITTFPDHSRLTFGTGNDLQIYHDGSNSYINDTVTGDLYIQASDNMYFQTHGSGKRWITLNENDSVDLFYNDALKLDTTSYGINVDGQVTASAGKTVPEYSFKGDQDTGVIQTGALADHVGFMNAGKDSLIMYGDGQMRLPLYTPGVPVSSTTGATLSPLQNFQATGADLSDTLTNLAITDQGYLVRGSQEATWRFTKAQLDALTTSTTSGSILISAPGATKAVIVEESNLMIKYSGTGTMSSNSFVIRQAHNGDATAEITRLPSGQINTIMSSAPTNPSYGFYSRDLPLYNNDGRSFVTNKATFLTRTSTNATPSNLISITIKLKYRLFDVSTF